MKSMTRKDEMQMLNKVPEVMLIFPLFQHGLAGDFCGLVCD